MRKRPLALLCLAVAAVLAAMGMLLGIQRDQAILEAVEYLDDLAGSDGSLTFEGTVAEIHAVSEGVRLSVNQIIFYTKDKSTGSLSPDLKFIVTTETDSFLPGDDVRVTGTCKWFEEARNPGQFDMQEYYFSQNAIARIASADVSLISEGSASVKRMLARIRRALRNSYFRILDDKAARTVSAISLGEKNLMEQEWKQLYQEGGIAHIISISGLHISMIGMFIYKLLRRLRLPFSAAALPSAGIVALYALMSGFGISAMRACFMFVIWLGAQIVGRKYDMLTAAAIAAVLVLSGNGRAASQSSFLLSFGAILSIAVLVPRLTAANPFRPEKEQKSSGSAGQRQPLERTNDKDGKNDKRIRNSCLIAVFRIWNTLCGGAGVWLGTLPVTLWLFYQTAPWSVLVNLIVIPLMSALMASGLISCLVGLVSVPAGTFLSAPVYYLLGLFERLCTLEQQLPCAIWIAGHPALWKVLLYYLLLTGAALLQAWFRQKGRSLPSAHRGPEAVPRGLLCVGKRRSGAPAGRQLGRTWKAQTKQATGTSCRNTKRATGTSYRNMKQAAGTSRRQTKQGKWLPALLWIGAIAAGIGLMAYHPRTVLTITSLDVGQGDGALIRFPDGTNILIDSGSTSVSSLWEYRVSQTVKYYGISTLDYVFLSHADSDHINGVEEYLEDYLPGFAGTNAHGITLKNLVLPPTADETDFSELITYARQNGIPVLRMEAGAVLGSSALESLAGAVDDSKSANLEGRQESTEAGWSLTCLAPSSGSLSGDKNEDSMVLLLQYRSFRMLFTGDLEGDSESALAASGADLSCDVLKVGHHGSKGASSEAFLAAAAPSLGIISCGKDNSYGHPAAAAVERLRAADIHLYTTMDCGALTIRSDGKRYTVFGYVKTERY
ncbi:MAG: ComEC/Rec2 family competence protein [Lachnospiraceae bacterium]|nr:ComEC/Rec2 family competence protein [Lachnospiraceae bacterium]